MSQDAQEFDFAPCAQMIKALVPRATWIAFIDTADSLLYSSDGTILPEVAAIVSEMIAAGGGNSDTETVDGIGRSAEIGDLLAYFLRVTDDRGRLVGVTCLLCRSSQGGLSTLEAVDKLLRALLVLVGRDISQRAAIESGRFNLNETVELNWLLDVTQLRAGGKSESDLIGDTLAAIEKRLDADWIVLHVPGCHLTRVHGRKDGAEQTGEQLRELTTGYLLRAVQKRAQTLVVNKIREEGSKALLPFRILCVPLMAENECLGVVAVYNSSRRRSFTNDDARVLERLVPRLNELVTANIDRLTGVQSRRALEERIQTLTKLGEANAAIVYGDVDQLHVINELYGFSQGDDCLRRIGEIWRTVPMGSAGGGVYRLTGDRFLAVLNGATLNQARTWAENLREQIARNVSVGEPARLPLTVTLGVAVATGDTRLEHAIAAAETACKAGKDRGRNRVEVFEAADLSLMRRHEDVAVFREIIDALSDERFVLFAQPIVPLWDPTRPTNFELLVRMRDKSGNILAPESFMSAATRYQLLPQIDRWVVSHSLKELAPYASQLDETGARFAINLSGPSLADPEFADWVRSALRSSGLSGANLVFEVTETAAIGNLDAAKRFIERLGELDCNFALDDFGTGLSSLAYLKELKVECLKIDGAFVRDVLRDSGSESMVRAVLHIARQLNLVTVAEHIEDQETAEYLGKLGVVYGQGYGCGAPQPLESVLNQLAGVTTPGAQRQVAG